MDSLHVTPSQQPVGSKTSSRSGSPSRLPSVEGAAAYPDKGDKPFHPHHVKTLSHGSVESSKVCYKYLKKWQLINKKAEPWRLRPPFAF